MSESLKCILPRFQLGLTLIQNGADFVGKIDSLTDNKFNEN